jgi:hypothetical protein
MSDATPNVDVPAKPPKRFRYLRIAVSVFFGVLTVLLVVLWGRSYLWAEQFSYSTGTAFVSIGSGSGAFYLVRDGSVPKTLAPDWAFDRAPAGYIPANFYWHRTPTFWSARVPYRFPALICAGLATIPWASGRFSVRGLLFGTAVVAVLLGLAVWAGR